MQLLGDPRRIGTELTVTLSTRANADDSRCTVSLLSDEAPEELGVVWRPDGADQTGPLQSGTGRARVKLLQHWLQHNPSLAVCKRLYVVGAAARTELAAALARFESEAVSAGTRQAEPSLAPAATSPDGAPGGPVP